MQKTPKNFIIFVIYSTVISGRRGKADCKIIAVVIYTALLFLKDESKSARDLSETHQRQFIFMEKLLIIQKKATFYFRLGKIRPVFEKTVLSVRKVHFKIAFPM